jgi:hypothetical protein
VLREESEGSGKRDKGGEGGEVNRRGWREGTKEEEGEWRRVEFGDKRRQRGRKKGEGRGRERTEVRGGGWREGMREDEGEGVEGDGGGKER